MCRFQVWPQHSAFWILELVQFNFTSFKYVLKTGPLKNSFYLLVCLCTLPWWPPRRQSAGRTPRRVVQTSWSMVYRENAWLSKIDFHHEMCSIESVARNWIKDETTRQFIKAVDQSCQISTFHSFAHVYIMKSCIDCKPLLPSIFNALFQTEMAQPHQFDNR